MYGRFVHCVALLLAAGLLAALGGCAVLLTAEQRQRIDTLQDDTIVTLGRVRVKTSATPESALNESIVALDAILAYTEQVRKEPERFDESAIDAYALKIRIINENIDRIQDLTLATDVSFPMGTYRTINLSLEARARLDELAAMVADSMLELGEQYPGHKLNLIVKTVGFTDEAMVLPGTDLDRRISAELGEAPEDRVERRQAFNKVLSRYRATSLNEYVAVKVRDLLSGLRDFTFEAMIVGKGEDQPARDADPPYEAKDPRRRICVVSPFVEVVP